VTKKKAKKKTKKQSKKPSPGRPLSEIDWAYVERMCAIHCTAVEISSVLGISDDTLSRACQREHGQKLEDYIELKRQKGKASLRRKQWKMATYGDKTMLVWLGKQWLGQSDKIEQRTEHTGAEVHVYLPDNGRE
jgi:hypothetical protein